MPSCGRVGAPSSPTGNPVGRRLPVRALILAGLALSGPAGALRAISGHSFNPCGPVAEAAGETWTGPLSRPVTLRTREVSLREALDRIAARARIRLSYSPEVLPLARRVCIQADEVPAGAALAAVLGGVAVRLVAVGDDLVVLAPRETASPVPALPPVELERIVVTGSVAGASQSTLPVALDVLDGRELARHGLTTTAAAFNAAVPGIWMWEQSPLSLLSQYGSIRGASSFGSSYPKVYLDGIQLANPLLLTRIQPGAIDRIELIRGPQGAALYGADAISGVANVVSRYDAGGSAPRARIDAGIGLAGSSYVPDPALEQAYAARLRTGSNLGSLSLDLDAGSTGSFVAGTYSRRLIATATGRRVGERSILTGTLRMFGMRAGTVESPVITRALESWRAANPTGALATPSSSVESLGHYTLGGTWQRFAGERWQHTLTVGVDGYVLSGIPDSRTPIALSQIATLNNADGSATRGTFRAGTVVRLGREDRPTDLTFSLEQSILRERGVPDQVIPYPTGASEDPVTRCRGNTALTTQFNATPLPGLHLSGGARLERDEGAAGTGRWATLPMAGAAWHRDFGGVGLKLRAAYGKGIRWPEVPARETLWEGFRPRASSQPLEPEQQSGIEAGMDLVFGRHFTVQVTRFDQLASGLIQRVALARDTASHPSRPPRERLAFELQNVGEITNRGWEVQASLRRSGFSLAGAFSQVDSRVRKVAQRYTGDLRPGDRMLEVPARTLSLAGSYGAARWNAGLVLYRAWDWINYDRVALARAFAASDRPARDYVGVRLRQFWKVYPGVTRLRATFGFDLTDRIGLTLSGENLLDHQTGEPDNITVLPGRTISLGIRTAIR